MFALHLQTEAACGPGESIALNAEVCLVEARVSQIRHVCTRPCTWGGDVLSPGMSCVHHDRLRKTATNVTSAVRRRVLGLLLSSLGLRDRQLASYQYERLLQVLEKDAEGAFLHSWWDVIEELRNG